MKKLCLTIFALVMTLFTTLAYAGAWGRDYGGLGLWSCLISPGGWFAWLAFFFRITFGALAILALVLAIRRLIRLSSDDKGTVNKHSRGLDILRERYAKGEISEEEFKKMIPQIQ